MCINTETSCTPIINPSNCQLSQLIFMCASFELVVGSCLFKDFNKTVVYISVYSQPFLLPIIDKIYSVTMSLNVPSAGGLARARTRTSLKVPSASNINLIRRASPILRPENQQRGPSSKERRRLRRPRPRSLHSSWGLIKGASGSIGSKKSQLSVGKTEVVKKKKHRKPGYAAKIVKTFWVYMANIDGYQASHQISPHNLCVALALNTIPIFVISIVWDLFAVFVFQLPHLSMLNHPGFMLTFHFICLPAAMYGYMMRVIMGLEETRMTRLTLISIVLHFVLLGIRATMELLLEGFRAETKQRYEVY